MSSNWEILAVITGEHSHRYIILYYIILYHIISYHIILYYILLYHIILYYIILYYIILCIIYICSTEFYPYPKREETPLGMKPGLSSSNQGTGVSAKGVRKGGQAWGLNLVNFWEKWFCNLGMGQNPGT